MIERVMNLPIFMFTRVAFSKSSYFIHLSF